MLCASYNFLSLLSFFPSSSRCGLHWVAWFPQFWNFGIIMDSNSISAQMVLSISSVSTVVIYTSYTYIFDDWNLSYSLMILCRFSFVFPFHVGYFFFFLVCFHTSLLFGSAGFYFPEYSSRVVFTLDIAVFTTRISTWAFRNILFSFLKPGTQHYLL